MVARAWRCAGSLDEPRGVVGVQMGEDAARGEMPNGAPQTGS